MYTIYNTTTGKSVTVTSAALKRAKQTFADFFADGTLTIHT